MGNNGCMLGYWILLLVSGKYLQVARHWHCERRCEVFIPGEIKDLPAQEPEQCDLSLQLACVEQ